MVSCKPCFLADRADNNRLMPQVLYNFLKLAAELSKLLSLAFAGFEFFQREFIQTVGGHMYDIYFQVLNNDYNKNNNHINKDFHQSVTGGGYGVKPRLFLR